MGGGRTRRRGAARSRVRRVAETRPDPTSDSGERARATRRAWAIVLGQRRVTSSELALDYLKRSRARLKALDVLFEEESWADVVRESQEVVELALKGLLLACGVEPPRVHDVSEILLAERARLPALPSADFDQLANASRELRRDRELAFYGAADLTPSGFYSRSDAQAARLSARQTVELVEPHVSARPATRSR